MHLMIFAARNSPHPRLISRNTLVLNMLQNKNVRR